MWPKIPCTISVNFFLEFVRLEVNIKGFRGCLNELEILVD